MQAPGNTTIGSLTAANSRKAKPTDKNSLILAYAISIGALGLAAGLHIKGLSQSKALKDQMLPVKKSRFGIHIPSSKSGLWEYLFGCAGGSFLGYFAHQAGENARVKAHVKGYNERYSELKETSVDLQTANTALIQAQTADTQAQLKLGRNWAFTSLLHWADLKQTIDRSTLIDKIASLQNEI